MTTSEYRADIARRVAATGVTVDARSTGVRVTPATTSRATATGHQGGGR